MVPRQRNRLWRRILLGLTVIGSVVLAVATRRALVEAATRLTTLDARALFALPLFAAWTCASAVGWRVLIVSTGARPSLARLFLLKVQAQSVNLVLPLAGLGGDALRASVLADTSRQGAASMASVTLDTAASIVACLLFAGLGTLAGWSVLHGSMPVRLTLVIAPLVLALLVWFAPLLIRQLAKWPLSDHQAPGVRALGLATAQGGRQFGNSVLWHIVERLLIVGEIWLYAQALGTPLSLMNAVFATALMTASSSALFFVPGQLGAADGGLALGLLWLGLPLDFGIAVALARRLRQLLVAAMGLLASLVELTRRRPRARLRQQVES